MEKSGFFNSSGGDRVYNAADFAAYFGRLATDGIFYGTPDNLKVTLADALSVDVAAGGAFIKGYAYENTGTLRLPLETAGGIHPRIDRVVLRLSLAERRIYLAVLTGTATATPAAPALTRSADVFELCLSQVAIAKGAVTLSAQDVLDTRLDAALCGLVNSTVTAVYV